MKTKIFTLAALILMTFSMAKADNFRSFKMIDRAGRAYEILVKTEEIIQERFEFNTSVIFERIKEENKPQMIDITPFVKPEQEIEECHPVYKLNTLQDIQ